LGTDALSLLGTVDGLDDADNVRYDPQAKLLYVGYGGGALAVIDPEKAAKVADIKLDGHPESFRLETNGNRIFVNVPRAGEIEVVDRATRQVVAKWPMKSAKSNFPMVLDEDHHRLFIGCRSPAKMLVLDAQTGATVSEVDCISDTDDLFYDAANKRVYISGGGGSITVVEQTDADHYQVVETIKTASGARTSFFSPDTGQLYLAVPHRGDQPAEIRVYAAPKPNSSSATTHATGEVNRDNLAMAASSASSQPAGSPLVLVQTVPLPDIKAGMNHMDADAKRGRVFVTAPSDKLLAVVDLKAGNVDRSITGFGPAAARFTPDLNILCVSGANVVRMYDGDSLEMLGKVDVAGSVDELQYDPTTQRLYGGITDSKNPGLAVIDVPGRKLLATVKLPAKPQGMILSDDGTRLYANTTGADAVTVVDCQKQTILWTWKLADAHSNYPIALDDKDHRLFVGCRKPAAVLVLDTQTGNEVAQAECVADTDDMSFDSVHRLILVSGGAGVLTIIQQVDADHYRLMANIQTASGARNSTYSTDKAQLYLAIPHRGDQQAALRVYNLGQ
jgi:DNA-binding beta-propeller fold protein YncE